MNKLNESVIINKSLRSGNIVLAVDDVAIQLMTIRAALGKEFDVRVAKSGKAALAVLDLTPVDLILLDIEMPGMSGFELLEQIKCHPNYVGAPVIFITTHDTLDFVNKAKEVGAAGYLLKPFKQSDLRDKVLSAFNLTRQTL